MYDMANSAYSVVITTAIFPIYYKAVANEAGVSAADSTAYLGTRSPLQHLSWPCWDLFSVQLPISKI